MGFPPLDSNVFEDAGLLMTRNYNFELMYI
jgi:hypothetical protein